MASVKNIYKFYFIIPPQYIFPPLLYGAFNNRRYRDAETQM